MCCHLHLGRAASRLGAPAVGDMWCHLHLGLAAGRPGAPAVGDMWCQLHLGIRGRKKWRRMRMRRMGGGGREERKHRHTARVIPILGGSGTNAESAFRVPRSSHCSSINSAFRVLACSFSSHCKYPVARASARTDSWSRLLGQGWTRLDWAG